MTPSAGSSLQGPAQCARVGRPPGLVAPAAAMLQYAQWDDPALAAGVEAANNQAAASVVAQQSEMGDKAIRSEDVMSSGVPTALLAFVPNGAEAEHYGGLSTLRTETKTPMKDQLMHNHLPNAVAVGQSTEGWGYPTVWREYVDSLFQTMRENFDMSDQGVVALQDGLENVGHKVGRMLSMANKWGDLRPF